MVHSMTDTLEFTRDDNDWLNARMNPFLIHIIPKPGRYYIVMHYGFESLEVFGGYREEDAVSKAHAMVLERVQELTEETRMVTYPQS